ncbi:hypothetical protein FACS189494_07540 [Spirochaetia bacterium]|nr:hypothetical protein FACS189494_07540 [Spirochaetia bacterium]
MEENIFNGFKKLAKEFKKLTGDIQKQIPNLQETLQQFVDNRDGPKYKIINPVVYNTVLDEININSDVKLILVGDNPGRKEQETGRYLVGPSGKIAENFFKAEKSLHTDFRKNVVILNKTPVHTPRTADLKKINQSKNVVFDEVIKESQVKMARLLCGFCTLLNVPVWITGYSEMKKNGIFETYTESLKKILINESLNKTQVFLFRHFSMNQFTIDLNKQKRENETTAKALERIGTGYRIKYLV